MALPLTRLLNGLDEAGGCPPHRAGYTVSMIRKRFLFNTVLALSLSVLAAQPGQAETLLEKGAWQAIKELEGGDPVCVMSAEPYKDEGNYTRRGTILAMVSHRPHEKRIGEVGFQAGYTFQKGSEASVTVDDSKTFQLFTQGGHAWAYDAQADKELAAAMRAGNTMVVKGTSSRGTLTTDTYSLSGFTAAWRAINKACGVK